MTGNSIGKVILKVLIRMSGGSETGDKWYDYYQYDTAGRVTLHASSAAVSSYSVGGVGGTGPLTVNLHSGSGLIWLYEYYTSGAVGYLQFEKIKQGSSGTPVIVREHTYTARTVSSVKMATINVEARSTKPYLPNTSRTSTEPHTNAAQTKSPHDRPRPPS